jgi:acetoacetyl-CoA synthetase
MAHFCGRVQGTSGTVPELSAPYADWHRWSCENPAEFWPAVWEFCGITGDSGVGAAGTRTVDQVVTGFDRMAPPDPGQGPRWFAGASLNFAENLLQHRGPQAAIIFCDEAGARRELSRDQLAGDVKRMAGALRAAGIVAGDRVAGFLPNIPETVIAMLGAASIGAVWSSCSPDFGVRAVLDRFGQIAPRVLLAADGFRYAGNDIDCLAQLPEIVSGLPTVERVIVVPRLHSGLSVARLSRVRHAEDWNTFLARGAGAPELFTRLPFDHPLCVMFSSGTTGKPKCIVHGAGGTLLQHLKEHQLHTDIRDGERVFYFTTCGWMMWNWLVSVLASGAAIVLYDGAPMPPHAPDALWALAAAERVNVFGTSARYLALSEKAGLRPSVTHDLSTLRAILSTGSPLGGPGFDYVYRDVHPGVMLASISGGTDIISCFALGNPMLPVWRGELQCRGLGMAVDVFDAGAAPLRGAAGELVCTRPFPSMPVAFWNDPDGAKYRAAYFSRFSGVWCHGDWAEITEHDGVVISGRSDATLNPGGVRIGSAEIYRQVEQLDEVLESVVIGQRSAPADGVDERIVLFVRLQRGYTLDDDLRAKIRTQIRTHTSPHHVPKMIVQVADIPRTVSGKITEIAVRDVVHGRPVAGIDAIANPGALEFFRDLPELRQ